MRSETLLQDRSPLPIGRRAVSLLIRLLEQPGELVGKDALMTAGWNNLAVEESNLATQMSALRKVLAQSGAAGWIETLPRRGYRYVGPMETAPAVVPVAPAAEILVGPVDGLDPQGAPIIAVLPFSTRDPALLDFAEGLGEDMVSLLSSLRGLVVISRASTLAVQRATTDAIQAGRALGVDYLVSGVVRRTESGLRVLVELASCQSGVAVWSHGFDTDPSQAPQAPVQIVARIVNTLVPKLTERELRRLRTVPVADLEVHQLLMKARQLLTTTRRDALDEALPLIENAIAHDRECGPAYALRAEWFSLRLSQAWSTDRFRDRDALEASAARAIVLDPSDPVALARAGYSKAFFRRDFQGGRLLLDRAVDAGPSVPMVWNLSSFVHSWVGDGVAARRHAERALDLSPMGPTTFQSQFAVCLACYTQGDMAAADQWAAWSFANHPRPGINRLTWAATLIALDRTDEARALMQQILVDHPGIKADNIRSTYPYKDDERRHLYVDRLIAAGCPR